MNQPTFMFQPIREVRKTPGYRHWYEALYRPGCGSNIEDLLHAHFRQDSLVQFETELIQKLFATLPTHFRGMLSVNASVHSLNTKHFVIDLCQAIDESHLDYGDITLELTEHNPIAVNGPGLINAAYLREKGIMLAIDDVGKPNCLQAFLQKDLIDVIKLDREVLVEQEALKNVHRQCLATFVQTFPGIVIAEGVERPQDLSFVRDMGIHFYQGIYNGGEPAHLVDEESLKGQRRA